MRGGKSLETAAREAELTLERSGRLQRRPDGFVPGLGAAQDLLALAFTLPAGASSPRIFEVGGKLALVQVLERRRARRGRDRRRGRDGAQAAARAEAPQR